MISVQVQITARCLKNQGKSIKQIARDLHLSRNTVRRYLRDRAVSDYPARPKNAGHFSYFQPTSRRGGESYIVSSYIVVRSRTSGARCRPTMHCLTGAAAANVVRFPPRCQTGAAEANHSGRPAGLIGRGNSV